jgi:chloramphenicol O-acetyltransferase type B
VSLLRRTFSRLVGRRRGVADLPGRYPQYQVGVGSYGDLEVVDFGEGTTFQMGAYCSVARGAKVFLGGGHRTDWVTTYPFSALDRRFGHIKGHPVSRGDVVIGSDVWLGREAIVLSGVRIGHGAVIGARAVVTKDVRPYEIVAGNPASPIRMRFEADVIERLLHIAWWDWPKQRIDGAVPMLLSSDISAFLDAVEQGRL